MIRLSRADSKFFRAVRNLLRTIDVRRGWQLPNLGVSMNEAFRVRSVRGVERNLPLLQYRMRATIVDVCRR